MDMMKHGESSEFVMPVEVPGDVVELILHKLPVLSLLRCRVVSKEWHSLITDPRFERTYNVNMATDNTNPLQLLFIPMKINSRAPAVSHEVDDTSGNCTLISRDHSKYRCMRILGSCNGLVGVLDETRGDFYLFNPCTGKEKHVHTDIQNMKGLVGKWTSRCAICYDSSKDEYKAVLCSLFDTFVVTFNDSGTSKLITENDQLPIYQHDRRKKCVGEVVNGVPHWRRFVLRPSLLLFDPQQEEFRAMDLPHRWEVGKEIFGIGAIRGKLSVALARAGHVRQFDFELIVMEEYGNAETWNLLFVINMSKKMRFFRSCYMTPLLMIEDDRILVEYNRELWIYNYNHNTMVKLQTEVDFKYYGIISYYPTLASPL